MENLTEHLIDKVMSIEKNINDFKTDVGKKFDKIIISQEKVLAKIENIGEWKAKVEDNIEELIDNKEEYKEATEYVKCKKEEEKEKAEFIKETKKEWIKTGLESIVKLAILLFLTAIGWGKIIELLK